MLFLFWKFRRLFSSRSSCQVLVAEVIIHFDVICLILCSERFFVFLNILVVKKKVFSKKKYQSPAEKPSSLLL